jgi:hypothetical protein
MNTSQHYIARPTVGIDNLRPSNYRNEMVKEELHRDPLIERDDDILTSYNRWPRMHAGVIGPT